MNQQHEHAHYYLFYVQDCEVWERRLCVHERESVCGLKRVLYKGLCAHSCVCLSIS